MNRKKDKTIRHRRRHHNTDGREQIRRGWCYKAVESIAIRFFKHQYEIESQEKEK